MMSLLARNFRAADFLYLPVEEYMQVYATNDEPIITCPLVRSSEFELFSDWGIRSSESGNNTMNNE
jgi:hypothetical protein